MAATALSSLLLALLVVLGGCGDGGSKAGDKKASPNGVASKPPKQITADAAAALKRARSVHLEGRLSIDNKPTEAKIDFEGKNLKFAFKQKSAVVSLVVVDRSVYINANAAFWRQQGVGPRGGALADRWFKVPGSAADLSDLTKSFNLATLSRCLVTTHGTLQAGGETNVSGRPAVVVVDKGDRPGTAPGKLFVATTGEPVPLRVTATGKERPGGKRDPDCNDPDSEARPGDELRFSRYNESLNITAPPGARDLTQPSGSSS